MSLATPVALSVNSFDATNSQSFSFACTGGNQVVANRITIVNATTSTIVYQNKTTTYSYNQTVPSGTLTNGIRYYFYFNTYDVDDNISADSNKVYFYCYSQSTISFTNIPTSGVINSASYTFTAVWNQEQDETLSSFQFLLYDNTRTLIDSSNKLTSSNTPPITFSHMFDGFDDDTTYYVSATATSSNGITVTTDLYPISINNEFSGDYFLIKATNNCLEGYNEIVNNVHEIDGTTDGKFIDDEKLLLEDGATVVWDSGLQFLNDSFVFVLWWRPILLGKIAKIESEDGNTWFDITFKRGIPSSGAVIAKDYILVEGYYNNNQYVSKLSNQITQINNNTDVITYLKVVNNNLTVYFNKLNAVGTTLTWNTPYYAWLKRSDSVNYYTLSETPSSGDIIYYLSSSEFNPTAYTVNTYSSTSSVITDNHSSTYDRNSTADNSKDGESNVIYGTTSGIVWEDEASSEDINYLLWDGSTNVEYNRITDLWYEDESQGGLITDTDWVLEDYSETYMTKLTLMNSIVDAVYITRDTSYKYTSEKPTWDNYTVMYCKFQGNVLAGNVSWVTSNITRVKLKRRLKGTQKWLTLLEKDINSVDDLTIEYTDYLCPSGYTFEYALVPCTNEEEWDYSVTTVDTQYDGLFLIDSEKECKKLYGGVIYNSDTTINGLATLQPYNRQYPVIIRNPNINYKQTNISGYLLNESDYSDIMSSEAKVNMTLIQKAWSEYLAKGKSIIIKDWNGKILMVQITTAPSYTYMENTGNAVPYITFTTSEIGQYNDATDLYEQGFLAVEA